MKSAGWDVKTATDLASCKSACEAATTSDNERYQWAAYEDGVCNCVEYVLHGKNQQQINNCSPFFWLYSLLVFYSIELNIKFEMH